MEEEEAGPSTRNGEEALCEEQILIEDPASQHSGTFADILKANTALQVAFYSEPTKVFTESEKLDFTDVIGDILFHLPEDVAMPSFVSTTRRDKYLIVSASDESSRDWLLKIAPSISIGAYRFHSIPANEIPKLKRGLLWLPGKQKHSDEELLKRLGKQNRNLSLENWRIFKRHEETHGVRLLVGVPEASITNLTSVNNRPQWSTVRAVFTPIEEVIKRKKLRKPSTPKPADHVREDPEDSVPPNTTAPTEVHNDPGPNNETFIISNGCSRAGKRKPDGDVSLGKDSTPESLSGKEPDQNHQTPLSGLQRPQLTKSMVKRMRKKRKDSESPSGKITAFFPGVEAKNSTPKSPMALTPAATEGMTVNNPPNEN